MGVCGMDLMGLLTNGFSTWNEIKCYKWGHGSDNVLVLRKEISSYKEFFKFSQSTKVVESQIVLF